MRNKNILEFIVYSLVFVLIIDFIGFCAWSMSGQVPNDNLFFGVITRTILQVIL